MHKVYFQCFVSIKKKNQRFKIELKYISDFTEYCSFNLFLVTEIKDFLGE